MKFMFSEPLDRDNEQQPKAVLEEKLPTKEFKGKASDPALADASARLCGRRRAGRRELQSLAVDTALAQPYQESSLAKRKERHNPFRELRNNPTVGDSEELGELREPVSARRLQYANLSPFRTAFALGSKLRTRDHVE
jgi:hypothetical protein